MTSTAAFLVVTFIFDGKPLILYTGVDTENRQVQALAAPTNLSDPFLRKWTKCPHNPLISPIDDIMPDFFRDPTTAWKGPDGLWRLIIGNQIGNTSGRALLYKSRDFVNWTRSTKPLHSSNMTGMWECPDFYPVSTKGQNGVDTSSLDESTMHVLKASIMQDLHDRYVLGKYNHRTDFYSVETNFLEGHYDLRYDYGKFYASKTFFDSSKKRRILWGWINESSTQADDIKKGWSGIQSVPRTIRLSENRKQLTQWPIEEIEKLRAKKVSYHDKKLKGGSLVQITGITASRADVEVSFAVKDIEDAEPIDPGWVNPQLLCSAKSASSRSKVGPFGLLVLASKGLEEQTAIYFHIFRSHGDKYVVLMCSDQSRSSIKDGLDKTSYGAFVDIDPLHEKISLRSLIDHSVVESLAGEGKACITARVYPELAIGKNAHLYAFNNGTQDVVISKLDAWSMKKAKMEVDDQY